MVRHSDPSGISGVGLVAYGVQFDDGHVAVRWVSESPSTSLWDSLADLLAEQTAAFTAAPRLVRRVILSLTGTETALAEAPQ